MENTIKMSKKNEEGKLIIKDIPSNLYSLYKTLGWEDETSKPKSSFSIKEEDNSNKLNEKN